MKTISLGAPARRTKAGGGTGSGIAFCAILPSAHFGTSGGDGALCGPAKSPTDAIANAI
jgi:hypothetical protein